MPADERAERRRARTTLGQAEDPKKPHSNSEQKEILASVLDRPWPCSRALCQAALTDKDRERGGDFDGILNMTVLRDDNVDLSVSGVEPTKGEVPEGKSESNRCTCFSHVRPCTLPAIGELACRVFRNILEKTRGI